MTAIPLRRIEGEDEILGKLGEGGMGAIYKVRHRLLDEIRVIKTMRPQLLQDEELKARFFREARAAIKLRHPCIAHLYDFSLDDDDIAYIVMEHIEGITLESLLRQGVPPLGLALEIGLQDEAAHQGVHGFRILELRQIIEVLVVERGEKFLGLGLEGQCHSRGGPGCV